MQEKEELTRRMELEERVRVLEENLSKTVHAVERLVEEMYRMVNLFEEVDVASSRQIKFLTSMVEAHIRMEHSKQ